MARRDARFDVGRAARERQRGLGDVARRVGDHRRAEFLDLGLGGRRAHQHAVAAGAVHLLDHQLGQVVQHVLEVVRLAAHPGGHVGEDRFLAQVEADHLGHVGVDRLVVRDARAHGVADGHVARAVGAHEARAAQRGGGAEHLRVEEVVVHPAVDHVHALQAARGAHVDEVVLDDEVLPLDQLHAHLLGQEGVLEVGAVVHAGREHHHRGFGRGGGGAGAQRVQQQVGVVRHRRHLVHGEQLGEEPHHHLAVLQHVRHAGGHAQVVFQHVIDALAARVRRAHDVDAADVRIDVLRHLHAHHLGPELGVADDQVRRHDARADDLLAVVHVVDEAVERRHALHQPLLHALPLVRGDDARDQVERNQPLGAGAVLVLGAVDGKGDAHAAEDHFRLCAARLHRFLSLLGQPLAIALVMGTHIAAFERQHRVHLVELQHKSGASCPAG